MEFGPLTPFARRYVKCNLCRGLLFFNRRSNTSFCFYFKYKKMMISRKRDYWPLKADNLFFFVHVPKTKHWWNEQDNFFWIFIYFFTLTSGLWFFGPKIHSKSNLKLGNSCLLHINKYYKLHELSKKAKLSHFKILPSDPCLPNSSNLLYILACLLGSLEQLIFRFTYSLREA